MMVIPTVTLGSFVDLIPAAVASSKLWDHAAPWCRGHARASWTLSPSVHRAAQPYRELNMADRFMLLRTLNRFAFHVLRFSPHSPPIIHLDEESVPGSFPLLPPGRSAPRHRQAHRQSLGRPAVSDS